MLFVDQWASINFIFLFVIDNFTQQFIWYSFWSLWNISKNLSSSLYVDNIITSWKCPLPYIKILSTCEIRPTRDNSPKKNIRVWPSFSHVDKLHDEPFPLQLCILSTNSQTLLTIIESGIFGSVFLRILIRSLRTFTAILIKSLPSFCLDSYFRKHFRHR